MNSKNCPGHELLRGYVLGTIPEEEAESIGEHVETCVDCEASVETLEAQPDSVVANLRRRLHPEPELESPEWRSALARVEAVAAGMPSASEASQRGRGEADPPPVMLGEYEILAKLGEGGMGAVYKARQTKLDKLVALKVLPEDRMRNASAVSRFEREMKAVGRLSHINIVQAHDAREIDGTHFLAMEYVEGLDLAKLVAATGPLRIEDACELIRQAAVGLQHAHEQRLVHRDIKPSNLMLNRQGTVKILDLGLALLGTNQSSQQEMTVAGTAMGTADYVSPEQVTDSHSVDIRSDIYSLGCTLYKLLSGRAPFVGSEYKNDLAKMLAHVTGTPPLIGMFRADLPAGLAEILDRMMAKKPELRFSTPGEVAIALAPFAAGCDLGRLLDEAQGEIGLSVAETRRSDSTGRGSNSPRVNTLESSLTATAVSGRKLGPSDSAVAGKPRRFKPRQIVIAGGSGLAALLVIALAAQVVIRITNKDGQLTEIRLPPGSKVEIVEDAKTRAEQPATTAGSGRPTDKAESRPAATPDRSKPFVLMRNGTQAGEFKGLGGALAALQAGDEVVVHGNGPFAMGSARLDVGLNLRAASGYRPRFAVGKLEPNRPCLELRGPLRVEGCDFVSPEPVTMFSGSRGPCEFVACRCYTPAANRINTCGQLIAWGESPSVRVRDCLLVNQPLRVYAVSEVELTNNITCVSTSHVLIAELVQKIRLSQNTLASNHPVLNLSSNSSSRLVTQVEAVGNLFHAGNLLNLHASEGIQLKDCLTWQGRDNLYVGPFSFHGWSHQDEQGKPYSSFNPKDFAAWKNLWGGEERSQAVERVEFQPAMFCLGTPDEALNWIRLRTETIRQQLGPKTRDFGPQWELIGPGEAYVRASAAAGKSVPHDQLRPDELEGGPFVLIRDGKAARGFVKLQDAADAVKDGDTIEIRTDGPIVGCSFGPPLAAGSITLRAAPGYRPVLSSDLNSPRAAVRLTIEGLHFRNAQLLVDPPDKQGGGLARLANCSFEGERTLAAAYWAAEGSAMEIRNCLIPRGLSTARRDANDTTRLEISNSVLGWIRADLVERELPIAIRQSIVESPTVGDGQVGGYCFACPNDTIAERTLFDSVGCLGADPKRTWKGTGNIYSVAVERPLEDLRTLWKSPEEGSLETDPYILDPRSWQLLPSSPGYRQGPDGRDFGADVSKIAGAAEPSVSEGSPAEPATSSSSNADRRAAEWVLSLGGYGNTVTIRIGEQQKAISAVKDLPADDWQLVMMELRERGTDDGLKNLKGLTSLTNLLICGPGVTDAGLANLQGLTNLESLVLHGTSVTDAGLMHLKRLPSLQSLALQVSRIGDAVSGNRVGDVGLKYLRDLPKLWYLELSGQPVTNAGLEHIGSLAGLENLELGYTSVSDAGLQHLKSLRNLKGLGLDGTLVSDAGLEYLKDLPKLNSLCLRGTNVTDAALPILVNHGAKLRLDDARVSAKGFADLKVALPGADIVWSERNRTVAEAVLAAGGTVSIRTRGQAEDRSVTALSELPATYFQVSRVSLLDVPKIPDDLFGKLSVLTDPEFDNLEALDLSGSPIPDCRGLAGLTKLKDLSLARTKVSDAGLEPLKQLKELRRLVLDACPINGTGLSHLKDLTNLTQLRLGCPQVGDLGVVSVGQLKTLEQLSLAGSSVSDEGLQHLRDLTKLQALDLSQTKVTAAGLAELRKALPQCQVGTENAAKPSE